MVADGDEQLHHAVDGCGQRVLHFHGLDGHHDGACRHRLAVGATNGDLKFAQFNGSTWALTTVDSAGNVGYRPPGCTHTVRSPGGAMVFAVVRGLRRGGAARRVFEAVGAYAAGTMDAEELDAIEHNACPTIGSCAGMFTANTMASVGEALGMSLPGSASAPAKRGNFRKTRHR